MIARVVDAGGDRAAGLGHLGQLGRRRRAGARQGRRARDVELGGEQALVAAESVARKTTVFPLVPTGWVRSNDWMPPGVTPATRRMTGVLPTITRAKIPGPGVRPRADAPAAVRSPENAMTLPSSLIPGACPTWSNPLPVPATPTAENLVDADADHGVTRQRVGRSCSVSPTRATMNGLSEITGRKPWAPVKVATVLICATDDWYLRVHTGDGPLVSSAE